MGCCYTNIFYFLFHAGIYQAVNNEEVTYCSLFSFQGNCRQFGCVIFLLQCKKSFYPNIRKGPAAISCSDHTRIIWSGRCGDHMVTALGSRSNNLGLTSLLPRSVSVTPIVCVCVGEAWQTSPLAFHLGDLEVYRCSMSRHAREPSDALTVLASLQLSVAIFI